MCSGNDACDHARREFLKSKRPSEITKAIKEWVDAIPHQWILILIVQAKESWQAEIDVLSIFLEKISKRNYAKILVEPNYKSNTNHVHYDHHTYNAILSH